MATIGKLAVVVSANADQMTRVLDSIEGRLATLGKTGGGGGMGGSALAAGALGGATAAVAMKAIDGIADAAKTALGVVTELGKGVANLGVSAVKAFAGFESSQIAIEGMLGSAQKAKELMAGLEALDRASPFTMTGLVKNTQQLLAFGFSAQDALAIMQSLADVAALSPDGMDESMSRIALALGQIRAAGRTTGEELRQLANANIPVWDALAKRLGVTGLEARKMVEQGMVDAATGIKAVMDIANDPRVAGMAGKKAGSLEGIWSTIESSATKTLQVVGASLAGAFELKGTGRSLIAFLDTLTAKASSLEPLLRGVGSVVATMGEVGFAAMTKLVETTSSWLDSISQGMGSFEGLKTATLSALEAIGVGIATVYDHIRAFVQMAVTGFNIWAEALKPITDLLGVVATAAMTANANLEQWFARLGAKLGGFTIGESADGVRRFFDEFRRGSSMAKDIASFFDEFSTAATRTATALGSVTHQSAFAGMMDQLRTPLEAYQEQMRRLNAMLDLDAKNGINSVVAHGKAALLYLGQLEKSLGLGRETRLPSMMEQGSKEAVSAIIKAQSAAQGGGGNMQDRLEQIQKEALRQHQVANQKLEELIKLQKGKGNLALAPF